MIKFGYLTGLLLGFALSLSAQPAVNPADYILPVKIPVSLSANYGELRPNHFHSGIDIKTQGVTGKPVYAVADGYVSRLSVTPGGYGKALYIQHPNGTTSVYGHVEAFYDSLENYVYRQQYARESFRIELTFQPGQFPVSQGQLVALSGNRGSSGGPHLHFEIRDAAQRPYNLVAQKILSVADTIPPHALTLYYIQVDTVQGMPLHRITGRIPLRRSAPGHYVPASASPVQAGRNGYFAVEVKEHKNATANVMGVYRITQRVDKEKTFGLEIDRVPFDLTRYANAVTLYSEQGKRNNIYRLFVLPNNPLGIYSDVRSQGMLSLRDDAPREVEIEMTDEAGNSSLLNFTVALRKGFDSLPDPMGMPALWWKDFQYEDDGLSVSIPARALYESVLFRAPVRNTPLPSYAYSPLYDIYTPDEPLQKSITVSIAADGLPAHLRSKALLGTVSASGKRSSAGGGWKADGASGRIEAQVRSFGTYHIAIDTVAPRIVPEFKAGEDLSAKKSLSLKISDNFSGIDTFAATIDGQWALLEYDPKNSRITHVFDPKRWPKGQTRQLSVTVTDAKGNRNTFTAKYKH